MIGRRHLSRFCRSEEGSITVETLLILPILFWCYLAIFVFFDAFQAESRNVKLTYAIADILSREVNEPITPQFMESMFALQGVMAESIEPRILRVSAIRYRESDKTYRVIWSQVRGGGSAQTDAGLDVIRSQRLPVMSDGEVGIIVESSNDHTPVFTVGLTRTLKFREFSIVRPRFAPTLCWSTSNTGPWTEANSIC